MITVVLPVHNGAATLDDALRSLVAQTEGEWQLRVVDDGSTDGSAVIATRWASRESRITVLSPGRVGLVEALRLGCSGGEGEYLARMDADDIAHPDRLNRQLAVLSADPEVGLCGTGVIDLPPSEIIGTAGTADLGPGGIGQGRRRYSRWLNTLTSREAILRDLFVECPLAHPTFLMRRSCYEQVGGYRDLGWPEDYDLLLRIWRGGWALAPTPGEPLLSWRDSATRLSRTDARYAPEQFRRCKIHHLLRSSYLSSNRPLLQWGAGEEGKAWLKLWPAERRPGQVVEIDPRKLGKVIHSVLVTSPDELGPPAGRFLVVAVGAAGARDLIRTWLAERGWLELRDFACVA